MSETIQEYHARMAAAGIETERDEHGHYKVPYPPQRCWCGLTHSTERDEAVKRAGKAEAFKEMLDEANRVAAQWATASPGEGSKQYRLGQFDANKSLAHFADHRWCEAKGAQEHGQ